MYKDVCQLIFFFFEELKLIKHVCIGAIDIHILLAQETNLI